jgi:hypothetical protein
MTVNVCVCVCVLYFSWNNKYLKFLPISFVNNKFNFFKKELYHRRHVCCVEWNLKDLFRPTFYWSSQNVHSFSAIKHIVADDTLFIIPSTLHKRGQRKPSPLNLMQGVPYPQHSGYHAPMLDTQSTHTCCSRRSLCCCFEQRRTYTSKILILNKSITAAKISNCT